MPASVTLNPLSWGSWACKEK